MLRIKRLLFLFALFLSVFSSSAIAHAETGIIAFYNDRTDKIIIQTSSGYTCGEVYTVSFRMESGQYVAGNFSTYGTHDIYNIDTDENISVYIDEYWLSADEALIWLQR